MRTKPFLIILTLMIALAASTMHGDRRVRNSDPEKEAIRLHELDRRQAADMEKAWLDLKSQRSKDHFIKAFIKNSLAPNGYELVRLKSHGTLINLSFQNLDDDDETRSMMIRAREILRLEVLERPW